jgi:hypothetical protein
MDLESPQDNGRCRVFQKRIGFRPGVGNLCCQDLVGQIRKRISWFERRHRGNYLLQSAPGHGADVFGTTLQGSRTGDKKQAIALLIFQ